MGTEAFWIPAVMTLVSAGAGYANQRSKQKKSDRIAMDSLNQSKAKQARADQVNNNLIEDISRSSPEAEKGNRLKDYLAQLSGNAPNANGGVMPVGGASDAYSKDAAAAALGIDAYGKDLAGTTSIIDGAGDQRRREGKSIFDGGLDLSLIGREQEGANRVTDLKLKGVRDNPWLQALQAVAGAGAAGYSGGGGGASAGGGTGSGLEAIFGKSTGNGFGYNLMTGTRG